MSSDSVIIHDMDKITAYVMPVFEIPVNEPPHRKHVADEPRVGHNVDGLENHYSPEFEAELEEMKQKGFDAGVEEGYARGVEAGKEEGFEAGKNEGFETGKKEGFEAGNIEGFETGKKEGFESSQKDGFESGKKGAVNILTKLEILFADLTGLKERLVSELEPQVVELAMEIAKKVIFDRVASDPHIYVALAKESLKKIVKSGRLTIRLSPQLYDVFMEGRQELLAMHPDIVFDSDATVGEDGFVITSPDEEAMVDIKTILDDISTGIGAVHAAN